MLWRDGRLFYSCCLGGKNECSWWKRGGEGEEKVPWETSLSQALAMQHKIKPIFLINFEASFMSGHKMVFEMHFSPQQSEQILFQFLKKTRPKWLQDVQDLWPWASCIGQPLLLAFASHCPECSVHVSAGRAGRGQFGVVTVSPSTRAVVTSMDPGQSQVCWVWALSLIFRGLGKWLDLWILFPHL